MKLSYRFVRVHVDDVHSGRETAAVVTAAQPVRWRRPRYVSRRMTVDDALNCTRFNHQHIAITNKLLHTYVVAITRVAAEQRLFKIV